MADLPTSTKPVRIAGSTVIHARNPMGGVVRLPGGTSPPVKEFVFETEEHASVDLEIMIRVLEIDPPIEAIGKVALDDHIFNAIRWQIWSLGLGDNSLDFPPPINRQLVLTTKNRIPKWPVPARGVLVRLKCRHLRLQLSNEGTNTEPLIEVSINPTLSDTSDWRPFPVADLGLRNTAGMRSFFPPYATQWRISQSFADGPSTTQYFVDPQSPVVLYRWSMGSVASIDNTLPAGALFDWTPIPLGAHSWSPGTAGFDNIFLTAEYR